MTARQIAASPIPWIFDGTDQMVADESALRRAASAIAAGGYTAMAGDTPSWWDDEGYLGMLDDFGLVPAPGYYQSRLSDPGLDLEPAREHARRHARLGLSSTFVADMINDARIARPVQGADFDAGRLEIIAENIGRTAEVMLAEGVRACVHPHAGTWLEDERETRAVLDAAPELWLGADIGHLEWAGADVLALLADFRGRLGPVHLKNVDRAAESVWRESGTDFWDATLRRDIWVEAWYGAPDTDAALDALGADWDDWIIVETDRPKLWPDPAESIARQRVELQHWIDRRAR